MKKVSRKNYEADLKAINRVQKLRYEGKLPDVEADLVEPAFDLRNIKPALLSVNWSTGYHESEDEIAYFMESLELVKALVKAFNSKYQDAEFED